MRRKDIIPIHHQMTEFLRGQASRIFDDVAKKANAELLPYTAEEKEKITSQIIADALCGFKNRKEKLYGLS